jgi:hypothetical protein
LGWFPTIAIQTIIEGKSCNEQPLRKVMNVEDHVEIPLEDCGTLPEANAPLSPAVVETMKIVFRETHGGEMTAEDREFLGIDDR